MVYLNLINRPSATLIVLVDQSVNSMYLMDFLFTTDTINTFVTKGVGHEPKTFRSKVVVLPNVFC